MRIFLYLLFLQIPWINYATAYESARSPFSEEAIIDCYAETVTHQYFVEMNLRALALNESSEFGYTVYRVSNADKTKVEKYPNAKVNMYLDGGSRVVSFSVDGKSATLYIPFVRIESDPTSSSKEAFFDFSGKSKVLKFFSVHPLLKATTDRMIDQYDDEAQVRYRESGIFPKIDSTKMIKKIKKNPTLVKTGEGILGRCIRFLRNLNF